MALRSLLSCEGGRAAKLSCVVLTRGRTRHRSGRISPAGPVPSHALGSRVQVSGLSPAIVLLFHYPFVTHVRLLGVRFPAHSAPRWRSRNVFAHSSATRAARRSVFGSCVSKRSFLDASNVRCATKSRIAVAMALVCLSAFSSAVRSRGFSSSRFRSDSSFLFLFLDPKAFANAFPSFLPQIWQGARSANSVLFVPASAWLLSSCFSTQTKRLDFEPSSRRTVDHQQRCFPSHRTPSPRAMASTRPTHGRNASERRRKHAKMCVKTMAKWNDSELGPSSSSS